MTATPVIIAPPIVPPPVIAPPPPPPPIRVPRARCHQAKRTHISTLLIPAGSTLPHPIGGDRWQLLQSPCPVSIRYDVDAGFATYNVGMGVRVGRKRPFRQIEITNPLPVVPGNPLANQIKVVIFVGTSDLRCDMSPLLEAQVTEGWIAMTGAVVALSTIPVYFTKGYFYAYQGAPASAAPVNNAAAVNIGKTKNLADTIAGGQWVLYEAPAGRLYNLQNFNALGNAPDGVFYTLTQ